MGKLVARLGGMFMALMVALGAGTGALAECAHAATDWHEAEDARDIVQGTVGMVEICTSCGAELARETVPLPLHEGDDFLFSISEFTQRLDAIQARVAPDWTPLALLDKMTNDDGHVAFVVSRGDTRTCLLMFHENTFTQMIFGGAEVTMIDDPDQRGISTVWTGMQTTADPAMEEIQLWIRMVMMACDPSLEADGAGEDFEEAIATLLAENPYYHSGIGYKLIATENTCLLWVWPDETGN